GDMYKRQVPSPWRYGQTVPTGPYRMDRLNGPVGGGPVIQNPAGFISDVVALGDLGSGTALNGTWTLALADGGPGDVSTLTNWELKVTYTVGVAATRAVWTPNGPGSGLFSDAAATVPYTGTPVDSVWTRPTPSGTYNYDVTVQSLSALPATPATPMAGGNANNTVAFNVSNNSGVPMSLTGISSNAWTSGAITARAFFKTTPIAGNPGLINTANGWTLATGSNQASNVTVNTLNPVLTALSGIIIPDGGTYGIALEFTGATFPAYTNGTATTVSYTNNGCTITTGGNVGWGGPATPGPMANNPRNFNGTVTLVPANAAPTCTSPARRVVVNVYEPVKITLPTPLNVTTCTNRSVSISTDATGSGVAYQWQLSTTNGSPNSFVNIANGANYSGVTTKTLTIINPPTSWNGYTYRCFITGTAPCKPDSTSVFYTNLTVNPLPTVVITANPYTKLFPGLRTTITNTSAPAAASYVWRRNGAIVGGNTSQITVDVDGMGDYDLTVTDVNGCIGTSNTVTISDSASGKVFIYPNPNNGIFQVRYYSPLDRRSPRGINIYDAKGSRVAINQFSNTAPYTRMDIDLRKHGKGIYWVEVVDGNGERLAVGRAVVL
nr:T9SS type A sorting domain-containing protein [Ferruginibacter sp.]